MSEMTRGAEIDLKIAAVLLAAGLSARMGERNKLLIPIGGEPLVRRMARLYLDAGADVIVVLGHEAELVRAALDGLPLACIDNPDFAEGQASSARAGIEAVPVGYDAMVMSPADLPLLTPGDIKDLVGAFAASDRSRILIPYFVSRRGNPVLFPADVLAQMRAQGLAPRAFIDAHPELTRVYAAPNDHFVTDMDTPEDLGALSGPQP